MSTEMTMLAWTIVLALVQLVIAVLGAISQRGMGWALGTRDDPLLGLIGVPGRLERAFRNLMETFPLFAAAVLAVNAWGHGNGTTALGAQLYFWGRVVYVPVYAAGIPYLRTGVWTVAVVGIVMVLGGLLGP